MKGRERSGKGYRYLAVNHGGSHAGWVVLRLVGGGDEVNVCGYRDGGLCLSGFFVLP